MVNLIIIYMVIALRRDCVTPHDAAIDLAIYTSCIIL